MELGENMKKYTRECVIITIFIGFLFDKTIVMRDFLFANCISIPKLIFLYWQHKQYVSDGWTMELNLSFLNC